MLLEHYKLVGAICLILGIHIFISSSIYLHTALDGRSTGGYFLNQYPQQNQYLYPGGGNIAGRDSAAYNNPYSSYANSRGSSRIVNTFPISNPLEVQIGISGAGIFFGIVQIVSSILFTIDAVRFGKVWLGITTFLWLVNLICFGIGFSSYSNHVQQWNLEGFYFSYYYINFLILSGALVYTVLSLMRQFTNNEDPNQV